MVHLFPSGRCLAALLIGAGVHAAVAQTPPPSPTVAPTPESTAQIWEGLIKQGRVAYHQLTADDFRVANSAEGKTDYYVQAFIEPRYDGFLWFNRGWVHGYIKNWRVFSGFDTKASYRSKPFKEMKAALPAAQAVLDLSEIRARELAIVPPDGWPEYRGGSETEVKAGLEGRVKALCQAKYDEAQKDINAFFKATDEGRNRKKVLKMAAEIRRRLDALPKPANVDPPAASVTPTPAPSPARANIKGS